MNKHFFILIVFLGLAGCTFIPSYHRPSLPVPSQFPGSSSQSSSGNILASDIGWQDFFKDPHLKKLIELALSNNRDYRVALLNVEEIRDQYRIIRYAYLPSFEIDANEIRQRSLASGGKYSKSRSYQLDVNTSYELDLFGHIRSLKAQALEQYLATKEASRSVQISLVSEVAVGYFNVRVIEEELDLLEQTFKSVNSYYDLINKSYQLGNSSALDLRLAQTQVLSTQVSISIYKRQLAQAQDALSLLIGQPIPIDLLVGSPLLSQDLIQDLPVGVSSDLIERRPDILQAEHQLKAANANVGAVKAAFFPSITLTGMGGTSSVQLAKLFTPGTQIWSFSPQISLPLFNENTNLANLNAAQVSKRIEIVQYEKAIQIAFSEVSDAIAARDTLNEQTKSQRDLVAAEQARYDLANARYKNGIDSYLTVLLAQQDLYNSQESLLQVDFNRLTNLVTLYKSLGGGWLENTSDLKS